MTTPPRSTKAVSKQAEQPKRPKSPAEVPEEFLDCRDLGHSWVHQMATENRRYHNFTRVVVCTRCGTERIQVISQTGMLMGSSYHYALGYLIKGHGTWSVDDRARMRLRNIRRMM